MPISQYVLKVHGRCDLACDICYVYRHADTGWRRRPAVLEPDIAARAAKRIAEHAAAHGVLEVSVILHGGEPLLLGKERTRTLLEILTSVIGPVAKLDLRIHTNGVRLDEEWCEIFSRYRVKVGISLDGDRAANDLHRIFRGGRSSHEHVLRALALLRQPRYRELYAGILCTIDIANDPVTVYDALAEQEPPRIDFLLPHATWEHPPLRPAGTPHPYADWLLTIYRRWSADPSRMPVRLFDSLLSAARGGPSYTETLGSDPIETLVIETDGSWEQPDSMRTAFDGAAGTGMDVITHSADEAASHPAIVERQRGAAVLCATCQVCPVVRVCGGGLYAHRYRPDASGFANPSVYCADLFELIRGVLAAHRRRRPVHTLPDSSFDAFASGPGDEAGLAELARLRMTQSRSLVAAVAARAKTARDADLRSAVADGWALLCELDRTHPAATRAVFEHPYTYAWALRAVGPAPTSGHDTGAAHLAGLALAAAWRAGVAAELPVPCRSGGLHLPSVGTVMAGAPDVVRVRPEGTVTARHGGTWRAMRMLTPTVALEDLDPDRDCQQWPVRARVSNAEFGVWRERFAAARELLAAHLPDYARVLDAGLVSIVPLRRNSRRQRAATAKEAFGAVAIAMPQTPLDLAGLLLHEFQHVKLHALLDMRTLHDRRDPRTFEVPWRQGTRPVEAVLHGAYAHLPLALLHSGEPGARYRGWVTTASDALLTSGTLTEDGRRFVTVLARAARGGT